MQYGHFLTLPGLRWVSRYQLAFALLMFLGSPGLDRTAGVRLDRGRVGGRRPRLHPPGAGLVLFGLVLVMWFAPKIATVIDVLLRADAAAQLRRRHPLRRGRGHGDHLLPHARADHVVRAHRVPRPALVGRSIGWGAQARDDHACRGRWRRGSSGRRPCSGASTVGLLAFTVPVGNPLRAVRRRRSAAVDPARGHHVIAGPRARHGRMGLARLPEETAPPPEMAALALPAVEARSRTARVTLLRTVADICAASPARCAFIMATVHDAAIWTTSTASS